ncbi:flavin-containing amine oxidase [Cucurbitaria berberidis CBS 394.84]|uniref:Amine oxidase n=1 Tax=Cucurbitaria berberidis CBS 394.84 TaxID=1168544 RepID=A0A9P4GUN0_9PLEO|nr:flavin-containing amine oxidase [Cucurbitaria berberidis CBS 394.84]KAF1851637.1 flavin-containing amine oxidase [Cucurbitaria berberidis CBS 394.84]
MATTDGQSWTPTEGLKRGLPCLGAISPPKFQVPGVHETLDVIVIGAGYAGLVAARDLTTQGKKTLLLEGRDRIGGRTWHGTLDGFNYEMGGTWIHWTMPHIYREVSLYGLNDDWIVSQQPGGKLDYATVVAGERRVDLTHDEEATIIVRIWGEFCNIDGNFAKDAMPYPFQGMRNRSAMTEIDQLSCRDRLNQIKHKFNDVEITVLESMLLQMGGGPIERMGLLDAIRWFALGGHTPLGLNAIALSTRLRSGQSTLHRKIFDHARCTGKLSYSFSTAVDRIEDRDGLVRVTSRNGQTWKARKVICTVPLNVLGDISFNPPLPTLKEQAIKEGSVQHCNKVHIDTEGADLLSYTAWASPGKGLVAALADNLTPAGDTHLVAFGPSPGSVGGIHLHEGVDQLKTAAEYIIPTDQKIKRLVYHDWDKDEFSKGTWCFLPPKFVSNYLDALNRPHGNVLFASADYSDGWRGWIDGAVQSGADSAKYAIEVLGSCNTLRL